MRENAPDHGGDARDALSLEPPEEMFDGEDVDTGEDAPDDDDLTAEELDDITGQAGDETSSEGVN